MKITSIAGVMLFLTVPVVSADEAADQAAAKAIVERAVKAAGWDKAPLDLKTTWKDKGTLSVMGMKMAYTADWAFAAPDKYHFVVNALVMGQAFSFTVVAHGDKAWEAGMGMMREVEGDKLEYIKNEVYHLYVNTLNPLLKDTEFKLKPLADKEVDGKSAAGVEVMRKGKPTMKLYFDKKTDLLVKTEAMVKDEFQGWKEALDEAFYFDWKDVGGRKGFGKMKVVRGGNLLIESEFSEQKWPDKLDAKLFEKPSGN